MEKEIKKSIKRILLLDSLAQSSGSLTRILDEVENELEELFGSSKGEKFDIEKLLHIKQEK